MIGFTVIDVSIEGIAPLLMHSSELANPSNKYAAIISEVSAKRKKTDSDTKKRSYADFQGGLYFDDEVGVYIPGSWVEGAFLSGGKDFRLGKKITAGLQANEDKIPLVYDGPRDRDGLYADQRFVDVRSVVVSNSRIMRTRPRFDRWAAEFSVTILDEALSVSDAEKSIMKAAMVKGMGDFRPRFGRFSVKKFSARKEAKAA